MTLEFLLRAWRRSGDPATLAMVTSTLDAMADGGINDQLGGGFARYSTDAHWLVPHFEKMLYDNALLAHAYLEGFRATGNDRYARVARETLDFMLAELRTPEGGFASALDADSEGVEGRFYTWAFDSFDRTLADGGLDAGERGTVATHWGVTQDGNWEEINVLHVAGPPAPEPLLDRARTALLAARQTRTRPGRDDKQLAAWNGLALRALAHASLVLGDRRYADATRDLVLFLTGTLVHDRDRLWRTARDGRAHTPGFAEDYACVADGLLEAHAASGDTEPLLLARALAATLLRDFWDDDAGHPGGHLERARGGCRPAARPRRQRHTIGQQCRRRRPPAPGPADRGRGAGARSALDPARRGIRIRAPTERVRADVERRGPRAR